MQIDVSHILSKGEGEQALFRISGETPVMDGFTLLQPVEGEIRVLATKEGLMAAGKLATEIELECDRCLKHFAYHIEFPLDAEFADLPGDDQFPIDKFGKIDLVEPVRQELDVHVPLQRLCQADCSGIELKQTKDS